MEPIRDQADPASPPEPAPKVDPRREMRLDEAYRWWRSTVPREFANAPNLPMPPVIEEWVDLLLDNARHSPSGLVEYGPSLMLTGGTGTGKTSAAWWAIGHLAYAGVLLRWQVITASLLYKQFLPGAPLDHATAFNRYARAPLLVIDDAGTATKTEFTVGVDNDIITERHQRHLPTIITTNLPLWTTARTIANDAKTLQSRMDDRSLSRLRQMSNIPDSHLHLRETLPDGFRAKLGEDDRRKSSGLASGYPGKETPSA